MKLSEQIKKYRKENNLTQEQFASKLFVSKQAVSKWETDRSYPDINLLPQIAEMLNISIDELIGKKDTENSTNNQEKIIEKKIPKKKKFICGAIVLFIAIFCVFLISILNSNKYLIKTKKYFKVKMPDIESFEIQNFENWLNQETEFGNYYPKSMYYYIFKDNQKLEDFSFHLNESADWGKNKMKTSSEFFPVAIEKYLANSDYYCLVNVKTKEINNYDLEKGINHFMLACYQINNKRLYIFEFDKEVK